LFLTRNILKDDAIFDDPQGNYLSKLGVFLKDHLPALQAALNLTVDEIAQILLDGSTSDESDVNTAILSMANISMLYRYGLLAKSLKLSIAELISIKALTGLNPFHSLSPVVLENIDSDYPLKHTLEFVHRVQQVKASALTISDLDFLMRHRFDPLGKYRENGDAKLTWIGELAAELNVIANDYAIPVNMDNVNDDALRQKMALVFPADVVEIFMGFWLNKTVFSVTKATVPPGKRLNPDTYGINGVNVSYDDTRQRQQLTHIGVLTSATKTTLLNQIPLPLATNQDAIDAHKIFSDLLNEIELKSNIQFETFFNKYFDGLLKFEDFFGSGVTTALAEKRLGLLQKILPFLQTKLTRQAILQKMTALIDGDATMIETLLTNHDFLVLPDATTKSLIEQVGGLGQRGLTAMLTPSDINTLPINTTVDAIEVKASDKYTKGLWRGSIEVPQNGSYRFYAKLGRKDATVNLLFDGMLEPVLNATATKDDDELSEFVELKSGVLYVLTLAATNLQDGAFELFVKSETTPKDKLSQFALLPQTAIDRATSAHTMLSKAIQLLQGLNLNIRDIKHILTNSSDFGGVNLRLLPTTAGIEADANARALFDTFIQLMNFTNLKHEMAGSSDDLIAIFEHTRIQNPETAQKLCKRIASLTRRKPDKVQEIATELKMTAPEHFADLKRIERLWQALQVVEKFGVSMRSLKSWLTPRPDSAVAMSIRNTIKSRYEQETWQRIAKSIFDPLRQRQRDALVAYILNLKEDEGLDSVEKLFEYFLIDPGMEPVVQTSRLRLAISSLQTFIQRCFLNLEKQVHPSILNAKHWSWMKRYRVWEANRKIFLFPENWLEPEWRDDKTHLYQELESSLLQGDVTNQLAEDALYVYLKKLDQLARLEIVTMYAEEFPSAPPTMHVIGRTYGLPHQYFYRRYAHQMWTAWEPVTTEIDGEHIVAVVWRDRLHLFSQQRKVVMWEVWG
jgi:Neuraminidase-like domain